MTTTVIHPSASVHPSSQLGDFVKIHPNVVVSENCRIEDHCVIGNPTQNSALSRRGLMIPPGSVIRSHSVLYEGSVFGDNLETGHHVVIREGTEAGTNLRVGNFSDIEGDCFIGDYCRFHGYVHVGKGSRIGHFVWLFSLVTLTNDPLPPSHISSPVTIEDGAVIAVGATPMPGSHVGKGAFVGAGNQVRGKVPPGAVLFDGKVVFGVHRLASLEHRVSQPWMNHFKDAYPKEAWPRIEALGSEVKVLALKV